ncbi:nucleotide sugar dehydrogenase [Alphaproteobacteria bacterium]|nr:nucleotide sugar dehydrogenase [Alphaproteobacteria bacterium]
MKLNEVRIGIIGLGYVGLPLAVTFSKFYPVFGFDVSQQRVDDLKSGLDQTKELNDQELQIMQNIPFTNEIQDLKECNCYIITVPTPVDKNNRPDLSYIIGASKMVASVLSAGDIVIYESTVYPGATEEECAPVLEEYSGLQYAFNPELRGDNVFHLGYSPERVNPGDQKHRLVDIVKVTSGSSPEIADFIDNIYSSIIIAGTHKAPSIKVAEAAKVIENTQRDVNIALVNELTIIFDKLNIDTEDVLNAAKSKWNFLPFTPGLVGGHCIGVDPFYLTHKAIETGYYPEIILAGRRLNDSMSSRIANRVIKLMLTHKINVLDAKVLMMGATFKENCPDIRNSKVFDLVTSLESYSCNVDIFDPWVTRSDIVDISNANFVVEPKIGFYDVIVVAVAHQIFIDMEQDAFKNYAAKKHVIFDIKYIFDKEFSDGRL